MQYSILVVLCCLLGVVLGCVPQRCVVEDDEGTHFPVQDDSTVSVSGEKTWLFGVSGNKKPANYLDDTGLLTGSDVDFARAVCRVANKKCEVVLAEPRECKFSDGPINYPGRGLMANWFDACLGQVVTIERLNAFDFTTPYKPSQSAFNVAPGNPSGFNPDTSDYTQFKFATINGFNTNPTCLVRLGKPKVDFIYAESLPELLALVLNRTVDAAFTPRTAIPGLDTLVRAWLKCDVGGIAVAAKKGSELPAWWDAAFKTFVQTGGFKQWCDAVPAKYPFPNQFSCLPNPLDFTPTTPDHTGKKVWLFGTSGNRKPMTFLDDQGKLSGFHQDLVKAVCVEAGQLCEMVLMQFEECSFTGNGYMMTNYAGRGIMDRWVDACPGYNDSPDREGAAAFSDAFLRTESSFAVVRGNPSGFNPAASDYSGFTIVHLNGAYTNKQCLARLNKTGASIVMAASLPEAKALLANGTANAIFSARTSIPDLDVLPYKLDCSRTGSCVLAKKGSPLVSWWNAAFRSLVQKGLYHQLCRDSNVKYNYSFKCFSEGSVLPTRAYPIVG